MDRVNAWLPDSRQLSKARTTPANVLVIGATNRAADLDPALLRPGRFDRSIRFDRPGVEGDGPSLTTTWPGRRTPPT